jgi:hypothetical protein
LPKSKHIRTRRLPKSFQPYGTYEVESPKGSGKFVVDLSRSGAFGSHTGGAFDWSGVQVTESEGHHWPIPRKNRGKHDVGGAFRTTKSYFERIPLNVIRNSGKSSPTSAENRRTTVAWTAFPAKGKQAEFPPSLSSSSDALNQKGADAIALCSPTNSVAAASTFLGEVLSDGLPRIPGISTWKKRTQPLLGVSEEFLNAVFGWLPMTEEIGEMADAIRHTRDVLSQYKRDEGKVVRRQFNFPKERDESFEYLEPGKASAQTAPGNYSYPPFNGPSGTRVRQRVVTRECWFSGAFTYHIPNEDDFFAGLMDAGSQADHLVGTAITPEVLWELVPWSWGIDWFSNAQSVITNWQNMELYGLVMRWGYLMEHTIVKDTYSMLDGSGIAGVAASAVAPVTLVTETKVRQPANPYGFGVEWADLSTVQLAILGALGITRAS